MSSKEIIKILRKNGWFLVRVNGSHHQFQHATRNGTVTVSHPNKDLPIKTISRIEKQSGIKF